MEEQGIGFKRKISVSGASLTFTVPKELCEHLNLKEGSEIRLNGFSGKYGKYIAFWNPDQKREG